MGTMIQAHRLTEADFRGERFADHPRDLTRLHDLLCLTQPDAVASDPRRVPRRRRRHHRDQHVQRDRDRAGRLRPRRRAVREINVAAARLARDAADAAERRTPGRPASSPARSARRTGPPRCRRTSTIRPPAASRSTSSRRLPRSGRRPDRRRRRPPADRDDLRHAQRQGGDLRDRGRVRRARRAPAGDHLGHDHRSHAAARCRDRPLEAFWISVAHARPLRRPQLRARPEAAAPARRRARRASPSVPISAHPNAGLPNELGDYDVDADEMARRSARGPRDGLLNLVGRLLRQHARAHRGDRRRRPRRPAARGPGARAAPPRLSGLEPLAIRRRERLRQRRRAHQRHGLGAFAAADPRRRRRRGGRGRARAGRGRRADDRRQHGRGDARRRRGDEPLPAT